MESGVAALEEHFVVRFSLQTARRIRNDFLSMNGNKSTGKSIDTPGLTLEILFSDQRHARVILHSLPHVENNLEFPALLVDLPSICETLRTTDSSQYVKVCDLSRMLLVLDEDSYVVVEQNLHRCDYQWPNGLTTPLIGMGKLRRIVKTARLEAAEREAQRLLDTDAASHKVSYALYRGDKLVKQGGDGIEDLEGEEVLTEGQSLLEEEDEQFQDQEYDQEDFAAELEGSLESAIPESVVLGEEESSLGGTRGLEMQLEAKRAQAAAISNPLIRARLQEAIADLESDLRHKSQNNNK